MSGEEKLILIMREGGPVGKKWVIAKEVFTIGRDEDCDIALPHGREVKESCVLQDGDEIQIALCVKLPFLGAEATAPLVFEEAKR